MRTRRLMLTAVGIATVLAGAPAAQAHSPDPTVGGALWAQNQVVRYRWRTGQVPPAVVQTAVNAAAADSNATRASNAAAFQFDAGGASAIAYGEPTPCGVNGIACFNRGGAPNTFGMWFRRHGTVFDWGTLRWCQVYGVPPDGCYDVENVALDEFGHVEVLGHHVNYADNSDYLDAVVQTYSRAKPALGWNVHAYGPCDKATLQLKYDMRATSSLYSTCLNLATISSVIVSDSTPAYRATVTFTGALRVATNTSYETLSANPLSNRTLTLQRRLPGGTWTNVVNMSPSSSPGRYTYSASITTTYEWRVVFRTPSSEGLIGDVSAGITVTVGPCTISCPQSAESPAANSTRR